MATEKLDIIVTLKDRITRGLGAAGKALRVMRGSVDRLKASVFNLRNAFIAMTSFFVGQKLISYADEQAKAVAGMETALRSMGNYTPELSRELQQIASDLQSITNYGDEAILMGQKFLLTYKDIGLDIMPRVSSAMTDLAALMGGDMRSAANMLGKASMGMTGELRRVGITVDANVYKMQGFVGVLKAIEDQSKGQAVAMRKATGSLTAMANSFMDVKEKAGSFLKVLLEPAFAVLLDRFDKLNESIVKLKKEGKLDEWANDISTKIMDSLEFMILGTITVYEVFVPIMKKFKELFTGLWGWFKELDPWVQNAGIILAIMGGKKVKWTLAFLALTSDAVESLASEFKMMRFEVDESATDLENLLIKLDALEIRKEQIEKGKAWRLLGKRSPEEIAADLRMINEEIAETKKLLGEFESVKIIDGEVELEEISSVKRAVIEMFNDIRLQRKLIADEAGKPAPKPPEVAAPEKIVDLSQQVKENMLVLELFYQQGKMKLVDYLEFRKKYTLQALNIEIEKIKDLEQAEFDKIARMKRAAEAEDDPSKKAQIEKALAAAEADTAKREELAHQLFVKKQEYALKEIELTKGITKVHEDAATQEIELEDILKDLKERAILGRGTDLESVHALELAELDRRQQEEMQRIMELTEFIEDEEEKRATIKKAYRDQELEKDKLLEAQKRALWMQRLDNAQNIAGGLADIFQDLYELGGKESKKMFELQKKAAIAEAIISTAKAVAGALGTPPYGLAAIANAAIIAIKGGLQIAKIKAQEMAEGGLVEGTSPHSKADNISIKGTAGEFMQPISAVKHLGLRVMEGIRKNVFPRELFEGFALPAYARATTGSGYADGGPITGGNSNFSVSVPINIDDNSRAAGIAGMLQTEVEETVIRVMERELR